MAIVPINVPYSLIRNVIFLIKHSQIQNIFDLEFLDEFNLLINHILAPNSKPVTERPKKTASSDASSSKASTKARRLQRASSREALLQSHGSSSEDLPTNVEAPVRKPRLIKKTKQAQLSITNGLELKKPVRRSREEKVESSKIEAR